MNIQHVKQQLENKERELRADIARWEADARGSREAEVEDIADEAISSETKATLFEETSVERKTLTQVREALSRIADGAYGKCLNCGKPIEPARLAAVPWASYCLADQETHDREASGPSTL